MRTLDEIAVKCGADKGSSHHVKGHDYARRYDALFSSIRNDPLKILEIGVGSGESMNMWMKYFPRGEVFGVDIVHDTNEWNTPNHPYPNPNYTFVTGDQSSEDFWTSFIATHGVGWDVCIDDGGHSSQQIITTFKMMWPHIKPGGYYAIEDLNCAYSSLEFFCPSGWQNHLDFIKDMLDQINRGQNDIDSLSYSCELCIIKKKA